MWCPPDFQKRKKGLNRPHPYYLKRLLHTSPNIPLIIEHLIEEDVPRAKKFVDQMLIEAGA